MKTYMFPGQGSQSPGMGGTLFDEFAPLTAQADAILGYSIKELCLEDPREQLNKTQFTQPALYVVNAFSWLKKAASETAPDFFVGHSLGEFNALLAAGCFDFETGLTLVAKRGELMSQATGGAMAAIMNASREEIESTLRENGLHEIDLANYNTPAQIVISGRADQIAKAQPLFQRGKVRYYPLNTSGAFHSRFMSGAMDEFRRYLEGFQFSDPTIPVISNVTAKPYQQGEVARRLGDQIASTVQWCESIQYLAGLGTAAEPMQFEEVGFSDVLTKFAHTIRQLSAQSPRASDARAGNSPPAPAPGRESVTDKVNNWNTRYPVGTAVKSTMWDYGHLETRTEALVLFGHRAAVYMKGYEGYFSLDEIAPA